MVVRNGRHVDIDRDPASDPDKDVGISALVHTGTVDFAAALTLPDAIAFQDGVRAEARTRRLRALRNRWAVPLGHLSEVDILTPEDIRLYGAITSFRIRNADAKKQDQIAARLLHEFGVFTVIRTGLAGGPCIRVTPALANQMADCDRLVEAVTALLRV